MLKFMSKLVIVVLILAINMGISNSAEINWEVMEEVINSADIYYETRSFTEKDRQEIMEVMKKAADKWKNNYDIQWRTARAVYVYSDALYYQYRLENYEKALAQNKIKNTSDVMEKSEDLNSRQSKILLEYGIIARKYADKAVEINPQGVEGHYYNALAIAIYAYGKSIIKAIMEGLDSKYVTHLKKAMEIKKGYGNGTIFSAYGRYWYTLPWPKRDLKKSLNDLLMGLRYNAINLEILDFLGDTYYVSGNKQEARKVWEECLKSPLQKYQDKIINKLAQAKLKFLK